MEPKATIKQITTHGYLLIPYFSIVGAIYHITFWNEFGLNGLSLISITDIIKSSIYPILTPMIFALAGMVFGSTIVTLKGDKVGSGWNTRAGRIIKSPVGLQIAILIWLSFLVGLYIVGDYRTWALFGMVAMIVPAIWLDHLGLWRDEIKAIRLRIIIIQIFVYLPIFAFVRGKIESEFIIKNYYYQYVVTGKEKKITDRVKFIGMTEKYIVLSDLSNKYIDMIKIESLDSLRLKKNR